MTPLLIVSLTALAVGVAIFLFLQGIMSYLSAVGDRKRDRVHHRLKRAVQGPEQEEYKILRPGAFNDREGGLMDRLALTARLKESLYMAQINKPPQFFITLSIAAAVMGFVIGFVATGSPLGGVAGFAGAGYLPFIWVEKRRTKRMNKFQRQLPDALDLIGRALLAGHSFNGGLRMVAEEMEDPIGPEFSRTLEEINYGMDPDDALYNLSNRVDCPDLKFFVVSVNIQRETGGNLSEIINNIASLVRERFKLHGKIRVLSAEGRLSALILIALPFVVALVIYALNPDYIGRLFVHPFGRAMLWTGGIMMALGALIIRRMVNIKV